MCKTLKSRPVSIVELAQQYATRETCIDLLESLRWPNGPSCPECGSSKAYRIYERELFECGECSYQYSVTSGTIMHASHLPLVKWILAAALICNARKGVSACQMARDLHTTYKTAWYLGHRLRRAMRETGWLTKFAGIVELDESYIGGKARGGKRGRGAPNKTIVFGAKERGGKVRMNCIPNVTADTIEKEVRKYVETDAVTVMADQLNSYNQLAAEFTLERIDHSREYVRGEIHTNGIESLWAILKRQVHGTHHRMSPQYLPLYLSEVCYRYNHRTSDGLFRAILRNALIKDEAVS